MRIDQARLASPRASAKRARSAPWRDRIVGHGEVDPWQLQPNPLNWRRHPPAQERALNGALSDVGWVQRVLVNKRTGHVVDGHLRYDLAVRHGEDTVPVTYVDLSEDEERLVLSTLDPIGAMATSDRNRLDSLLHELAAHDVGLDRVIEDLARANNIDLRRVGLTGPDEAPPAPEPAEVYVKAGDLWVLGDHRLLCGDASEEADLRRVMGGEVADCLWTDSPYGVAYAGKTKDALTLENDDGDADLLLRSMLEAARSFVVPGAPFYCCAPAGPGNVAFQQAISAAGWRLHQELVWVKDAFVLGNSDYHYAHEPIYYGWAPGTGRSGRGDHVGSRWYGDHRQSSVLAFDRPKRSEQHPTMKPVGLIARCLANSTPARGSVLDPFVGSGSTLLAAEQLNRRCFAIDIDPTYVQVAIDAGKPSPAGRR